jgi:7,8-dihydro-6-hydroxymethylpterin-pyrophosphokinase
MDPIDQMRAHFLLLLFISCGVSNKNESESSQQSLLADSNSSETKSVRNQKEFENQAQTLDLDSNIYDSVSDSVVVTDDDFILDALERVLDLQIVMQKSKVLRRETLPNKFDTNQTDTIVTLIRVGKDVYEYYVSPVNATLLAAEIATSDIVFRGSINIGTPRRTVLKAFKVKEMVDRLIVADLERYSEFEFQFKQDTLRHISFISRYLD